MSPKKVELIIGPCAVESYEQMEKNWKDTLFLSNTLFARRSL